MPYTVVIDGIQIQCETADEAVELARRVQSGDRGTTMATASTNGGGSSRWTEQRVTDFYGDIKG